MKYAAIIAAAVAYSWLLERYRTRDPQRDHTREWFV